VRARSGAVTAGAAGDLARGDVAVASLVQMSASDMAGAVASPAEETHGDASVGRAAGDRRDAGREPSSVARGARCFSARVFDRTPRLNLVGFCLGRSWSPYIGQCAVLDQTEKGVCVWSHLFRLLTKTVWSTVWSHEWCSVVMIVGLGGPEGGG